MGIRACRTPLEHAAGDRRIYHVFLLQVHLRCAWDQLLDHLLSAHALRADAAAAECEEGRAAQDLALQRARHALGADQVISVCSEADRPLVVAAAGRLCELADAITSAMDMTGEAGPLHIHAGMPSLSCCHAPKCHV